jgi:CTP synthase
VNPHATAHEIRPQPQATTSGAPVLPPDLYAMRDSSDPGEEYSIIPEGYRPGNTKFIVITGSVISGLGKGVFSAGLAALLEQRGYRTNLIKMDGYFNEDAGTLSPYRHGEVFVLEDGTECDMDIGTYERFVDKNFSHHNIFTNGRLSRRINELERSGQFSGSDVQYYPHVTGEIIRFVRESTVAHQADITLVEIGGTVGDEENRPYLAAMSDLAYQEGEANTFFINLVWIIEAPHLNEQKSKAAQHGTQLLMQMGVKPQMLVCRCENAVDPQVMRKLAHRLRLPTENVVDLRTLRSIYHVPGHLHGQGVDTLVLGALQLAVPPLREELGYTTYINRFEGAEERLVIGLAGKYMGPRDTYASIHSALEHAGTLLGARIEVVDIPSDVIDAAGDPAARRAAAAEHLDGLHGLIVPGGFGRRGWEGKIACLAIAREAGLPTLGICYGFQAAVVEYARACCDLDDANTTENDHTTSNPVVCLLPEQYEIEGIGGTMRLGLHEVRLAADSRAATIYGDTAAHERFRHRFELNPLYRTLLEKNGMVFSGWAPGQPIMQVAELPEHPFFVGVQYHPEFTSRPKRPHPLFRELAAACLRRMSGEGSSTVQTSGAAGGRR